MMAWKQFRSFIPDASRGDTTHPLTKSFDESVNDMRIAWNKTERRSDNHLSKSYKIKTHPDVLNAICRYTMFRVNFFDAFVAYYARNSWENGDSSKFLSADALTSAFDDYLEYAVQERFSDSNYLLQYLCDGNGAQLSHRDAVSVQTYLEKQGVRIASPVIRSVQR